MNLPVYTTDTLLLEQCHSESVLEAMVHTLLFHRLIYKKVKPKEATNSVYDRLHYVMIDDDTLHRAVTEKIRIALSTLKEKVAGTLSIVFYCTKGGSGWFSKAEQVEVEKWSIPIHWHKLYDKSITHSHKEKHIKLVYESFLGMLSSAPVPVYQVINDDLPFDIVDPDKSNSLKDIFQFIISGPPKFGIF